MTWEWVHKVLCDPNRAGRYSPDDVRGMTWAYVVQILFCRRDDKGNPVEPIKEVKEPSHDDKWWIGYQRGFPLWQLNDMEQERKRARDSDVAGKRK